MFKRIGLLLAVTLAVGAFGTSVAADVTLTVAHPWTGDERDLFIPVLEAAEEALGITIGETVLRTEDLVTILPTQWAAGTAPADVIFITDTALLREGARGGHVANVSPLVDAEDYVAGTVEALTVDGEVYGAPFTQKPKPGFFYRHSFFEEHGLTPPEALEEFEALLDELMEIEGLTAPIASGDEVGWPLTDVTEHYIIAHAGAEVHRAVTECTATDEDWEAFEGVFTDVLVPHLEAGYFSEPIEWTTALERWWGGDFGIYFQGIFILGMVDDPDDVGVFTIPGADGVISSVDYLFVNQYSPNLDVAQELFQWLVTEGQVEQVQHGGHIGTYEPATDVELYPPAEREIADAIAPLTPLLDMDDTIGGVFQSTFWDELKLLWVAPDRVDEVLENVREAWEQECNN